jgi:hypothetical protein
MPLLIIGKRLRNLCDGQLLDGTELHVVVISEAQRRE